MAPNLIIAGVNKAGTTSLFKYLGDHPDACPSSKKETQFFMPIRWGRKMDSLDQYYDYFKHCKKGNLVFESSPGYLYGGKRVASTIKKHFPSVIILFIFRDPVKRLFSNYKHAVSNMWIESDISFRDFYKEALKFKRYRKQIITDPYVMRFFGMGCYAVFLEEWYEVFNDEDIKVYFFEDLISDAKRVLYDVCEFVRLDSSFYDDYEFTVENKSFNYKNPVIHKFATTFNESMESILRRHHRVKSAVRSLYRKVNQMQFSAELTKEDYLVLSKAYAPYNREFSSLLTSKGYKDFPEWLT